MRYRRLGRTALQVSELCLGTMNFGPQTPEDESFAIMDRALELGINFFDTADRYGGDEGAGATESIIGRWFAQGGGRREKVVLATKLFGAMSEWPNDGRLSARHIRMACDDSLRRMQTDHIDLYQMHHVDRTAPWEEVWQAMDTLIQQGKITYVGSSNFAGWHIARANEAASRLHTLGLVSEQSHYNLLVRTVELEVLPACREYGVGVIPWSPLSGGLLGGVLGDSDRSRRQSEQSLKRIDQLRPQLDAMGEDVRRPRGGAGGGRAGVAPGPGWRHLPDHRPAHDGPVRRRLAALPRDHARTRHADRDRRHLPRPWRHRPRGLRLVAAHVRSGRAAV